MNFEDERWVRFYVRDTPTYAGWHWHTRAVAKELLRKVDRDGRLEWPSMKALCAVLMIPDQRVVERGLREMAEDGTISLGEGWLEWPRFVPGQNAVSRAKTGAERTAEWRAKKGSQDGPVMRGDNASPQTSPRDGVTNRSDQLSSAHPTSLRSAARARPRKPAKQLDAMAESVLTRIDEHRARWAKGPLPDGQRHDVTILRLIATGATLGDLLEGVDARAEVGDRDPNERASLNATTPFGLPSARGAGGWSWTCHLVERRRARGASSSPATETPEQRASRERYEQAKERERAVERDKQRQRDLALRPKAPAAKEIPDDVA